MTEVIDQHVSQPAHPTRVAALEIVAAAAALLYKNGQTTERTVVAAERLGRALGVGLTLHPHWGEVVLQVEGAPVSELVRSTPLGVDMGKVLAVMKIFDQVCDGALPGEAALAALAAAGRLPPASVPRFALFAAVGAAALGVIFGALDVASLLLIAFGAGTGALVRRWLARLGSNPFIQPLCAAAIAGAVAAAASRLQLSDKLSLVAFCPCMVLVPGPHILNGAIDLSRARITLGLARLTCAGLIVLMICAGLLAGLAAGSSSLSAAGSSAPVPLIADVIAAGCAVAAFGTFFSMPWRLLAGPCGALGADRARRRQCRGRGARHLHPGRHHRYAGRRSPAPALRRPRFLRRRIVDAGLLSVPHRECTDDSGRDRTERTGRAAHRHRCERHHGVPDHPCHDLRADPAAHAVRALPACSRTSAAASRRSADLFQLSPPQRGQYHLDPHHHRLRAPVRSTTHPEQSKATFV
jgi:uncharacterized membrane protein YjjP (DUF1212 family)